MPHYCTGCHDPSRLTDDELAAYRQALREALAAVNAEDDARHPFPAVPEHARRVKRVNADTIELTP
jgi:hypothetical protein